MAHPRGSSPITEPCLNPTFPPPCPHRIPTVPPPYPNYDLECAIVAQLGVSRTLESSWKADGGRLDAARLQTKRCGLTGAFAHACFWSNAWHLPADVGQEMRLRGESLRLLDDHFHEGDLPRLHLQSFSPGRVRFLLSRSLDGRQESDLFDCVEPA